jgi:Na+/H+ antiporter NhaC
MRRWTWITLLVVTLVLALTGARGAWVACWPAVVSLGVIVTTRHAAAGLAAGLLAGCLLISGAAPGETLRALFADHLFPSLLGPWHVGALVFTLLLGAFAGVLESSGGFETLLRRLLGRSGAGERVLGATYGIGLLCFFDGLANSLLLGRIARPAADRAGVPREKLAWVVDSTSSPVACVAFLSTWIATQLSLIGDSLPGSDPYLLYFQSIPANPYCLLTLAMIPAALFWRWNPGPMGRCGAVDVAEAGVDGEKVDCAIWRVLLPLAVLAGSIALFFQLLSGEPVRLFSLEAWRVAASSSAGPAALVGGAVMGLLVALACHPQRAVARDSALHGAAGLLPALVILVLAWALGSVFSAMGAAEAIQAALETAVPPGWLALTVFGSAAVISFATGSSWGTMALVMPLALGSAVASEGFDAGWYPAVIGAVFGGAVFGDHASPFSDTTIVSAHASGCDPTAHVWTQLPYALAVALAAAGAYALMALEVAPWLATGMAGLVLLGIVRVLTLRWKRGG